MPTYTTTSTSFCDTDAEFRALIVIVHAMLTACGWVQTADTGQVNTATVTYPASNSTDATSGASLWYLNDALHATAPIFMRIAFGRGTAAGSFRTGLTFSLTGTTGAGSLTGSSTNFNTIFSGSPSIRVVGDATLYNIYASGGAGRFGMVWMPDAAASPYGTWMMVERFRNSDGTPNANGAIVIQSGFRGNFATSMTTVLPLIKGASWTPTWVAQSGFTMPSYLRAGGSSSYSHFGSSVRLQSDTASMLKGNKVYAAPLYPPAVGEKYPLTQILLCAVADFPTDFSNVTIDMYGGAMVWKPMGVFANDPMGTGNSDSPVGLLLRYE